MLLESLETELTNNSTTVYNFQVEDFHTYYVGENGVCVHNSNCTPDKKYLAGVEKEDLRMMLKSYGKPRGCTWHHLEDGKGMLLVETKIHSRFNHSSGASILRNVK